jgi:hypothetical protein
MAANQGHLILGIWFTLFAMILAFLFISVHVRFSDIRVDDERICAGRFDLAWQCIRWDALRKIMKVTDFDLPSNAPRTFYCLLDSTKTRNFKIMKVLQNTPVGAIAFEDRICAIADPAPGCQ